MNILPCLFYLVLDVETKYVTHFPVNKTTKTVKLWTLTSIHLDVKAVCWTPLLKVVQFSVLQVQYSKMRQYA